jgi:hypothetical protein
LLSVGASTSSTNKFSVVAAGNPDAVVRFQSDGHSERRA